MIVKIQDDNQQDKHLIEAERFTWDESTKEDGFILLLCYRGPFAPKAIPIEHGARVFFMNDQGKTIDSKRIVIREESNESNN